MAKMKMSAASTYLSTNAEAIVKKVAGIKQRWGVYANDADIVTVDLDKPIQDKNTTYVFQPDISYDSDGTFTFYSTQTHFGDYEKDGEPMYWADGVGVPDYIEEEFKSSKALWKFFAETLKKSRVISQDEKRRIEIYNKIGNISKFKKFFKD